MDVAVDVEMILHTMTAVALVVMAGLGVLEYRNRSRQDTEMANRILDNAMKINERTQALILKQAVVGATERLAVRNGDVGPIFTANTSIGLAPDAPLDVAVPDRGAVPTDPEDDLPDDISVGMLGGDPVSFDVSAVPTRKAKG